MRGSSYYRAEAYHARRLAEMTIQPNVEEVLRRAAEEFQSDLLGLGMRIFGQLGRRPLQQRLSPGTSVRNATRDRGPARHGNKEVHSARKPAKKAHRLRRRR